MPEILYTLWHWQYLWIPTMPAARIGWSWWS